MITNFYIIRHGETDMNRQGIVQGRGVDSDLNAAGRNQADCFYQKYNGVAFDFAMISTLKRTEQTAMPFLKQGLPVTKYIDLDEIHWGESEGKKSSPEMHADFKKTLSLWASGDYTARTKGGETAANLGARLLNIKAEMEAFTPETTKNVLVVSHGRTLRALMCLLCNETLSQMEKYEHSNTGLFLAHFNHDKKTWTLSLDNDTSHLKFAGN